jgi:hypothetical protein
MDGQGNYQGTGYVVYDDANHPEAATSVPRALLVSGGKWGKFCGVLTIITGALSCLGILTIPVGIFTILAGMNLLHASEKLSALAEHRSKRNLDDLLTEFCAYTKNYGIYFILSMVGMVLTWVLVFALFAWIFSMASAEWWDLFPRGF